ncbi:hypothetical protein GCM10029992_54110 [Glycomyces albus]
MRRETILFSASDSRPISVCGSAGVMRWFRYPVETYSASATIWSTIRSPRRAMSQAAAMPMAETAMPVIRTVRVSVPIDSCTSVSGAATTNV